MISIKIFMYPLGIYYKKYIKFFYNIQKIKIPKIKIINFKSLIIQKKY